MNRGSGSRLDALVENQPHLRVRQPRRRNPSWRISEVRIGPDVTGVKPGNDPEPFVVIRARVANVDSGRRPQLSRRSRPRARANHATRLRQNLDNHPAVAAAPQLRGDAHSHDRTAERSRCFCYEGKPRIVLRRMRKARRTVHSSRKA